MKYLWKVSGYKDDFGGDAAPTECTIPAYDAVHAQYIATTEYGLKDIFQIARGDPIKKDDVISVMFDEKTRITIAYAAYAHQHSLEDEVRRMVRYCIDKETSEYMESVSDKIKNFD